MAVSGPGGVQIIADQVISGLSAGTHTIAAFYGQTGGGNFKASNASGQLRQLTVYDEGTV